MIMKKYIPFILLGIVILMLTSCLAGPNTAMDIPSPSSGKVAGFFMGLWHGIISPVTFFISLFFDKVSIYEVHNTGGWYDFGFVLGAGILFGGGSRAARRRR
jgi:hypothetical protein